MAGLLSNLQSLIKAKLESIDYLDGVTVVAEAHGDVQRAVDKAVGQCGLVVAIITPGFTYVPAQRQAVAEVMIAVIERPTPNRGPSGTGKPAVDVAEEIFVRIRGWRPDDTWTPVQTTGMSELNWQPEIQWQIRAETKTLYS